DLMERGIKTDSGDRLGKTIIFAQNKRHADFIIQRFDKLYPNKDNGKFCRRVICDDAYAGTLISDFKKADSSPHIVVSVDMMDTGIDVPECVNLVFFKKVRSKTKFWQMIGRGTRLAPELLCTDEIDGEYLGKRRFLIFDYCGNFEFFREKPNGFEGKEAKSLSESIYGKEVTLIMMLQGAEFAQIEYQNIRGGLVKRCLTMVQALNNDLVSVRLQKQYVEKFAKEDVFTCLSEGDKGELIDHIAPLVHYGDNDVDALRFDSFMYGLMIAQAEQSKLLKRSQNTLRHIAEKLEQKATIPQVQTKIQLIRSIDTDDFWTGADLLTLENVRKELRELLKFLDQEPQKIIITHLNDPVIESKEGEALDAAYDFEDYRKKVNRYVEEHGDSIAIHKLKNNVPLTRADYQELERVLTQELGNREDYEREFGDTPFGLLIRKITKLDHEAAMNAFSKFIDDEALNQKQIAFVHKIINHVEQNGYMEDVALLTKPPFDKPVSFVKMFDNKTRTELIDTLNHIRENAVKVIA
ncbi:MAG: DEAD/DEAH box helicase, partial [Lachnospiraceae bacterium]|nr:DEAD/DEAH box helicase [Lachnospiraceae bacterium]